jgi:putative chitobiose transport system substrate-binding protein
VKHVKKVLAFVMIFSLLALTACNDSSSGGAKDGKAEITFWTISLSPTFDDYINGMIADFEKENPNIKVKWQDIPFDQVEKKTLTAAASGQLGDVMNLNTDYLKKLAALGAVKNLEKDTKDVKDDFFPGIWDAGKLEDGTYALPWYLSNEIVLYNKELLKKAGYDNPPTTEEEAWEMSKVIKEKTGAVGHLIRDIHVYLPANGVDIVSKDLKSAAINSPEALEIFKEFKQRFDDGLIPKEVVLGTYKHNEAYAQEKLAWWNIGPQLFRQVKDLSPEVYAKSDAAPSILGTEEKIHVGIMNIAVAAKTKHPEASIKFAKFVTNAENQLAFGKIVPILPSVIEATEDEFYTDVKEATDPADKGRFIAAKQLEKGANLFPPVENISQINKAVQEEFQKVLLEDKDPELALKDAETEINKLLK